MSTADQVHWQQDGLQALPETDGHGDTCGPIVILDYVHVTQGCELSIAALDALRQKLIAEGLMQPGGMTMGQVVNSLEQVYGVKPLKVVGWGQVDLATYHSDLKAAMLAKCAVIEEPHDASAYPDGQAGVQNHFVLHWGIDSALGYYTCNGDTYTALRSHVPVSPVWYTWANIVGAIPSSYCILPAAAEVKELITLDRNADGTVIGAHDDKGHTVGSGFAQVMEQRNLLSDEFCMSEFGLSDPTTNPQRVVVSKNAESPHLVQTYSQKNGLAAFDAPDLAIAVLNLYDQVQEAPATQPPAQKPDYTQQFDAVTNAISQLHSEMLANGEVK